MNYLRRIEWILGVSGAVANIVAIQFLLLPERTQMALSGIVLALFVVPWLLRQSPVLWPSLGLVCVAGYYWWAYNLEWGMFAAGMIAVFWGIGFGYFCMITGAFK